MIHVLLKLLYGQGYDPTDIYDCPMMHARVIVAAKYFGMESFVTNVKKQVTISMKHACANEGDYTHSWDLRRTVRSLNKRSSS